MAFPFYQGNIEDLLKTAGQGQGAYLLGQMAKAQRDQQAADLEKSSLGNLETQQRMAQSAEKHPLDMQQVKEQIENWKVNRTQTQEQTRGTKMTNDVNEAVGVPTMVEGRQADIRKKTLDVQKEQTDQLMEELLKAQWRPLTGGGDQGFTQDVEQILKKYGMTTDDPRTLGIIRHSNSEEAWKAFQDRLYKSTPKGREQEQKATEARQTATELQAQRSATAIRVAEINAQKAEAAGKAKNYQQAATQMLEAHYAALEAGDANRAAMYKDRADNFARLAGEQAQAAAAQRQAGGVDIQGATGGQIPTRPAPAPIRATPQSPVVTHKFNPATGRVEPVRQP